MSQWNLSVRITGQGAGLARTLRTTAQDARDASSDIQALRRDISLLRRQSRNAIRLRVRVDAGQLRSDVSAAINSAGAGQGLGVSLRIADTMQLRREVENAVRWAAWGHRIDIPIGLRDPMQLRRDVTAAVRRAQTNQSIRLRVTADTSGLNGLGGALGGGGQSGGILGGLLMMAPAAIPLTAGLSLQLASLTASLGAAGLAGTAFGVALAGQVERLSAVADAEKTYTDAVREHGIASAEASQAQRAYQQQLAQLPPEGQKAAVALSTLKTNFKDWSDEVSGFTMTPVTKSLTLVDALIPRLTPQVKSFSGELNRLLDVAGGAITTPGFDHIVDRFDRFSEAKLDEMTDQVIHFLRVLSEGGHTDGALGEFIDYARENGPAAREALRAISEAVVTLLQASAEAGPTILALVTAAARLVAALPPELVGIIIQVATALKLLQLTGAGMAALAVGVNRVRTSIVGLGVASAAAGGGLAGLRAAFLALGVAARASLVVAGIAAVALVLMELSERGRQAPPNVDKLTNSLRQLGSTGRVTGEAAKAFGKDLSGLHDRVKALTDPSTTDKVQQFLVSWTGWDSTPVEDAKKNIDAIDKSLADLVKNGQADLAAAALKKMMAEYAKAGRDTSEITSRLDDYKSAMADVKFEQELAAAGMGVFGKAAQEVQATLNAQKQSADGLRQSIMALNDANRSAYDTQIAFERSIDDLSAAFKENGASLDISTEAGQKNGAAMSTAAKAHDEMIAAGLASGESLESMVGKSDQLRSSMMRLATDAFGGNTKAATEYVNKLLGIPGTIKTAVKLERQAAITGLQEVQAAIQKTPDAKSVTVTTLNGAAIAALEAVGYKTRTLEDGRTEVYTENGQAIGSIDAVSRALTNLNGRTATTWTFHKVETQYSYSGKPPASGKSAHEMVGQADGGVVDFYADGGMRKENHVAQIARGGSWRIWAEDETQGESYIPLARSKRPRSRAIAEETVRRLGGDPAGIAWNANGSVTDWRYDPQTGSLYSPSDAGQAGNKTKKVKGKEVNYFDLGAVERKIKSTAKATQAWNADLQKVADRVGGDVAEALASMGKDGTKLADKMANGSTKYINDMAKALRNLQKVAKASLTDYTRQLGGANKLNKEFSDDLAKLAAMGYGDLAAQLAEQNDTAAQQLADAAVKDKGKASKANTAAKAANNALTSEQVQDLVQIIAAIKTNRTGIHDVAASTGLGEDEIIAVANKATGQIRGSLGTRAARFLTDLKNANAGKAYANGGIRAGLYATQGGIYRFAEPETGGEALIPLGSNKRRHAMPVLANVAQRFGVGLSDAAANRPVVIVQSGDTINVPVTPVRSGATASDIGSQVGRSVRRVRRGGVNARATAGAF